MHYCSQGEGNWCTTVLKEKGTGVLSTTVLRIGEEDWCSAFFRIRYLVLYCSQEKETVALLFSGERNRGTTVLRRRKLVLCCFQDKGTDVLQFSG